MTKDKSITWKHVDAVSLDLHGWKAAVIGGTGGLGRAIARVLASRGASVTVVGQTFRDEGVAGIAFVKADLSSMKEAERVAKELPAEQLDLLMFTTGTFAAPRRQATSEGLERDMAVSFLNRIVMLRELAPHLGKNRPVERSAKLRPRVFVMGYPGTGQAGTLGDLNAEKSYSPMTCHMNTVAGNEMLVLDAVKRYPHATSFGLNPGLIKTNIRDNFLGKDSLKSRIIETLIGLFMPSPEAYAQRTVPLLVSPDIEGRSGAMFNQKGIAIVPSPQLADTEHVQKFLQESEALVARAMA